MHLNKRKLSEICAASLLAGGLMTCIAPAVAATAAGTLIKNLATVTYEDENGNTYSAQSNEAVITVKQVYSAEITEDTDKTAAAGQTVYIQHTLKNTGNGEDTYTLNAVNGITGGDSIDAGSIKIFRDNNDNGLADAGETEIASGDTITLAGGEAAKIVLAVAVPNTAAPGETLGVTLNATATNGTVVDTTAGQGRDGNDETNEDLITVSEDAVLNYTKEAVLDEANNQIVYTLTLSNTGNQAATDVSIVDAFPADTTFVSTSASGLLTANSDTLPAEVTLDEATEGVDLNQDGDTSDSLQGIEAIDASIGSGQTVSVTFTVSYDPATFNNDGVPGSAGDVIENIAWVTADLDGDNTPDDPISSNPTQNTLPQSFDVQADDTEAGADPTLNDGGDDDDNSGAPLNDTQTVTQAPSGSTVLFNTEIVNNGSGPDTMELAINKGDFPAGTTFTYWNAAGTAQLTDTNSEGGVDTGVLDAGETATIMVKAQLPTDVSGDNSGAGYTATLTSTSANDPATTPVSDTVALKLGEITDPGVDLADEALGIVAGDEDAATAAPLTGDRTSSQDATVGGTVNLPLFIDNESGSSDSYQLTAGNATLGPLPDGWSVQFYAADGSSGNPTGSPITTTPLLPPGTADKPYVAVVSIPNDPAKAEADYSGANALDGNGDGDNDQPIVINVASSNSGASDNMLDAIDVTPMRDITLTPPGNNQIQPGGSVDYSNALENTGNTQETVELTSDNSANDWNNTTEVDTTGDGVPNQAISSLSPSDTVYGTEGESIEVTDPDGDGLPELTLEPGEQINLAPTVFAPSDAAPGSNDVQTITATAVDPASGAEDTAPDSPTTAVENTSTVITGQVRLEKLVAYDAACDGTADGAFETSLPDEVAPGECAIWQITAENQGDAPANNVIIQDGAPTYTTFEAGSLRYQLGSGTESTPSDAVDNDEGEEAGGDVTFYVGTTPDPANGQGGTLVPGQSATVKFSTKVE